MKVALLSAFTIITFKRTRRFARVQEHHGEALRAIEFNQIDPGKENLFATVGSNQASVSLSSFPSPTERSHLRPRLAIIFTMA